MMTRQEQNLLNARLIVDELYALARLMGTPMSVWAKTVAWSVTRTQRRRVTPQQVGNAAHVVVSDLTRLGWKIQYRDVKGMKTFVVDYAPHVGGTR